MKLVAFDYIVKPFGLDEIEVIIQKLIEKRNLNRSLNRSIHTSREINRHTPLLGSSPEIETMRKNPQGYRNPHKCIDARDVTGKEVVSNHLHYEGKRFIGPFVDVRLRGNPIKSTGKRVIWTQKGSPTGPRDKKRKLELDDWGTLFLDDIGAMPL